VHFLDRRFCPKGGIGDGELSKATFYIGSDI
jgi:hypothetical protein